jgi:hypothetical protein
MLHVLPISSALINHTNNIRWRIQAMMFIIMQFALWSIFLPLRSKHPQFMFLPQSERPSFTSIQHNWQNHSSVHFDL